MFVGMALAARAVADVTDDDDDDYDPLPGRTPEQIEALIFNFDEVVETVALYTALLALLAILLALAISMRLIRWGVYVCLTTVSLVWFALAEQQANGLFWIGVDLSLSTLVLLGFLLISIHFFVAGWFLRPGSSLYAIRPLVLAVALLPLVAIPLTWPVDGAAFPALLSVLATVACLAHFLTLGSYAKILSERFYSWRNLIAVLVVIVLTGLTVFGELDEEFDVIFAIRSTFVSVVILFAFFLVQFVLSVLRERDASIRSALDAAKREAEQKSALLEAEKKYTRAREAAQMHTRRLATASHDIRQPITSLRSTMAVVAKDQSKEIQSQLNAAFDYLDGLAKSYMETEDAPNAPETSSDDDGREVVSAKLLCETLDRMFRKEAEAKGLKFSMSVEDQNLRFHPLVLTRILSNLLSNAVKHTAEGIVNLKASKSDDGYAFAISNTAELPKEVETDIFEHGEKGEQSDGSGFGLAIIKRLSNTHGHDLSWNSDPAHGTTFQVLLAEQAVVMA